MRSVQSKINVGPRGSYVPKLYEELLEYDGWTNTVDYHDIEPGDQLRFLYRDTVKDIVVYRAGGFLLEIKEGDDNEYFQIRTYAGSIMFAQFDRIVDLWHRKIKRTGRPRTKNKI